MENQVKIDLYLQELLEKNKTSALLNLNGGKTLRVINHNYEEMFNKLAKGIALPFYKFDLIDKTVVEALSEGENEDALQKKTSVFVNIDETNLNNKLSNFSRENNLYLTLGTLEYFDDLALTTKYAPLVLMKVKVSKKKEEYFLSCDAHEITLNIALIDHLLHSRHVDISYGIDNDFNLIDYLTYVSSKVTHLHFEVSNGVFITPLDLNSYYNYLDFTDYKDKMETLPLIKSISYLNKEFFNLSKNTSSRLSTKYLSLLNVDNEEYDILKRVNLRENMFLSTSSYENKKHIFNNIIYDFLINNKKVIITYDDEKSYKEIMGFINNSHYASHVLDFNHLNKEELITRLLDKESLDYDGKFLDKSKVDETCDTFYLLKNNYKKIINSLRRTNEPLKISLNRAIWEYYNIKDTPLINISIPNVTLIDEEKVDSYLREIHSYVSAISKLKCYYSDHPFYGFNATNLDQQGYHDLKTQLEGLNNEFVYLNHSIKTLSKKYHFNEIESLKELKAVLNIINLIPSLYRVDQDLFIKENTTDLLNDLKKHNQCFETLNASRSKIISLYNDRVFLIDHNILKQDVQSQKFNKKLFKNYSPYFNKSVKVDEEILTLLSKELEEYYTLETEVNNLYDSYRYLNHYYQEGVFLTEALEKDLSLIKDFNQNVAYLVSIGKNYSYHNLTKFDEKSINELNKDKVKAQTSFNHLLDYVSYLQTLFDESLIKLVSLSFKDLEVFASNASKNFASINDYLEFYLSKSKINKLINSLGDALLNYPSNKYVSIFMKRFYYDYAMTLLKSNPLISNATSDNVYLNIKNFMEYDNTRNSIIDAFIKNNIKANLNNSASTINALEIPHLDALSKQALRCMSLNALIHNHYYLISSLYPVHLINSKDVSRFLSSSRYNYDIGIVFASSNMLIQDSLPTLVRCDQEIVFDNFFYNVNAESFAYNGGELFINSAKYALINEKFISSSYKSVLMEGNNLDNPFKDFLIDTIKENGYLVEKNVITPHGTIDILVKGAKSLRPSAISLDRFNYYTMESFVLSTNADKEHIESLGYAPYRVFIPYFFLNEKEELAKLLKYLEINTAEGKYTRQVTKIKSLTEVLFKPYKTPSEIFASIEDKQSKSKVIILKEIIEQTAPVSINEIAKVFKNDTDSLVNALQTNNVIYIKNNFIFLIDGEITFRRGASLRDFDTVSNEEIAIGIKSILTYHSLNENDLIKLILKSLCYTTMNSDQKFRLQNIISDLLENDEIFYKDDTLYIKSSKQD